MRLADATTLFRTLLIMLIVYLIIAKFNAAITVFLLGFSIFLDAADGYAALKDMGDKTISPVDYILYAFGDKRKAQAIKELKENVSKHAKFGPRMDVAGDRVAELALWAVFTYLHLVPLFVFLIVIVRHAFVDALMGAKGTSSRMHTGIARALYASKVSRLLINVLKFVTFVYLALAYISGYPLYIGYVLVALLVTFICVRGLAEVLEMLAPRDSKNSKL